MARFIGRAAELGVLSRAYRSTRSEFIPIYGRRRVGKSELVLRFMSVPVPVGLGLAFFSGCNHPAFGPSRFTPLLLETPLDERAPDNGARPIPAQSISSSRSLRDGLATSTSRIP